MADLSKLSTEDLVALKSGDLSNVSTAGLQMLRGPQPKQTLPGDRIIPAKQEAPSLTPGQRIFGPLAEPVMAVGSAMVAKPLSEIAGLAAAAKNILSGETNDVSGFKKEIQDRLTFEPKTDAGKAITESPFNPINVIGNIVGGVSEGAGNIIRGNKGGGTTARDVAGNVVEEAIPQALGFLGVTKAKPIAEGTAKVAEAIAKPVTATAAAAGRVVDPWLPGGIERTAGRGLSELLGPKEAEVAQALANQKGRAIVAGSKPTAAEVAAPVGSAELSGLQKFAQAARPSEYAAIDAGNEAARTASIAKIAKTEAALKTSINARLSAAKTAYGKVEADPIIMHPDIAAVLKTDAGKLALDEARRVASNKQKELVAGNDGPRPMTVGDGQLIKEGFDELLKDPAKHGIGAKNAEAIGALKTKFIDWMNKQSKGWEDARLNYSADSSPINRMLVGKELLRVLREPLGAKERPAAFAGAVENAPRTLKRATGTSYFRGLEEGKGGPLTPGEARSVRNVVSDLAREAEHKRLEGFGETRAREVVAGIYPQAPGVGVFAPKINVIRSLYNRLAHNVQKKTLDKLAAGLETPEGTLALLRAANVPAKQQSAIVRALVTQNVVKGAALTIPSQSDK